MKLMKGILYSGIIVGIILCWEIIRHTVLFVLKENSPVIVSLAAPIDTQILEQIAEKPKSDIAEAIKSNEINVQQIQSNLEQGFADIAKKAMRFIVNVSTIQLIKQDKMFKTDSSDFLKDYPIEDYSKNFKNKNKKNKFKKEIGLGAGFIAKIIGNKAFVITNNHVIEKTKKIAVFLSDETELPAEIYAVDTRTDLAVLCVDLSPIANDLSKISIVEWGNSDNVEIGNWVIAIGNPFGFSSTITNGIVSAKGRGINLGNYMLVDEFIQHSASINAGNSGGCLLNIQGQIIGVNSIIASPSGGSIGIGFAIPSNIVKQTVEQLIEHKKTLKGWLGVSSQIISTKEAESLNLNVKNMELSKVFGCFLKNITSGGPAEQSDLKKGDIVIEVDGKRITEKNSFSNAIGNIKIDTFVNFKILRQSRNTNKWEELILPVKIGDFEEALKAEAIDNNDEDEGNNTEAAEEVLIEELGITIKNLIQYNNQEYDCKVVVTHVDKSNLFFSTVFVKGDEITQANNQKVKSIEHFQNIIEQIKRKNASALIPFIIQRENSNIVTVTVLNISNNEENNKNLQNKNNPTPSQQQQNNPTPLLQRQNEINNAIPRLPNKNYATNPQQQAVKTS